jgi:adenylate kinase family enzyme
MNILIIGTSGVGKTTLGRNLATELHLPHYNLDSLYWKPNWVRPDIEEFRARITGIAEKDGWIMDGNYESVHDITWPKADVIIWLDYSFWTALKGMLRRAMRREEQAEGCPSNPIDLLPYPNSLLLWTIKMHFVRKKYYAEYMNSAECNHIHFIRLKNRVPASDLAEHIKNL